MCGLEITPYLRLCEISFFRIFADNHYILFIMSNLYRFFFVSLQTQNKYKINIIK